MKISFVLPVYNTQATVHKAIKSLLDQTHEDKEIIVINDCSTDNTERICDSFGDKIKLTWIVNKEHARAGAACCRNYGNLKATGEIIAVCDADYYYPNRGEAIAKFFKKYKKKDVFYSGLHLQDARRQYASIEQGAYEWDFKSKCPIPHATVAYRREAALKCPYHEESLETDLYEFMLLDMHKAGHKFGGCQDPLMIKIEGNSTRDVSGAKKLKAKKYKEYGIDI